MLSVAATLCIAGCNVGMQPSGPSPDEVRAKIATMPPEKQIEMVQNSPMPPAAKAAKIAELESKYGIKASAPSRPGTTP
jgi:hypothetical protein